MPYCPRCGVESDPSVTTCALCATPLPAFEALGPGEPAWPAPGDLPPSQDPSARTSTRAEKKSRAFLAVTGVFAAAALTVTAVDLGLHGRFTWSPWPLEALAAVFVMTLSVFVWAQKPARWGAVWALVTLALLAGFDAMSPARWFLPVGLPAAAASWGLLFGLVATIRASQRRGWSVPGWIFTFVWADLAVIDLAVTHYAAGVWGLGWSVIAGLALVPLAFFCFFLHLTFRQVPAFGRVFHF